MNSAKGRVQAPVLLTVLGVAALVIGIALHSKPPPLPPITILPRSYENPPQHISLFARLVPATRSWAWLWRAKEALFGKIHPIQIRADIISFSTNTLATLATPDLDKPDSPDSPALKVWLLDQNQLNALRQQLKQTPGAEFLSSPRITTGSGVDATLFAGSTLILNGFTNQVGVCAGFRPRITRQQTDLTVALAYSEAVTNQALVSVRTNLDLKARFQLAKDQSVFLLQPPTNPATSQPLGILISTKL